MTMSKSDLNLLTIFFLAAFLQHEGNKGFDAQSLVGLGIWFACVLYSSIRTSTNSQVAKITMSERILMKDTPSGNLIR